MTHVDTILHKMCEFVGADFDTINFKEERWFWKHQWTQAQENEFKQWMVSYLLQDSKARREIMFIPTLSKHRIKMVVDSFVFNYGWKIKTDE